MLPSDDVARPYVLCAVTDPLPDVLPALIDSGADASSIPLEVAVRLKVGFDRGRRRIGHGAGGPFVHYEADGDVTLASEIGPITLRRPSINPALPFVLLGRRDFFAERRICIDESARRTQIETA